MKFFLFAAMMSLNLTANASVKVLFHPQDPTLETIAKEFTEAKSTIDIAMYNMDTVPSSPIVQTLQTPEMQKRIQSGELKIRLVLELYGTPEENQKKRQAMEDLGVDVRFLNNKVKIHHKFAVIDTGGAVERVITGSANWSVFSEKQYSENILFFEHEPEITSRYQLEFNRLWKNSQEFGIAHGFPEIEAPPLRDNPDMDVYFNSPRTVDPQAQESSAITPVIVGLIDGAKHDIRIATTRIRINEVLKSVLAAAQRGVKIQIVISEDDYHDLDKRSQYLLANSNVEVRIKFYNLNLEEYIAYQMHNKFMLVDGQTLLTGSFNWSFSSENDYIENVVVLRNAKAQEVLPAYQKEYQAIWNMNRDQYAPTLQSLQQGQHPMCEIPQMVLTPVEIRQLLQYGQGCKLAK